MLNFIRTDLKRMFHAKSFFITMGITAMGIFLGVFFIFSLLNISYDTYLKSQDSESGGVITLEVEGMPFIVDEETFDLLKEEMLQEERQKMNPGSMTLTQYGTGLTLLLFFIFFTLFVSADYQSGYLKNLWSITGAPYKWLGGKMSVAFVYAFLQPVVMLGSSYIVALLYDIPTSFDVAEVLPVLLMGVFITLAFAAVILALIILTESRTMTMLIGTLLAMNIQSNLYNAIDRLHVLPFDVADYGLVSFMGKLVADFDGTYLTALLTGFVFMAVSLGLGLFSLQRKDLQI